MVKAGFASGLIARERHAGKLNLPVEAGVPQGLHVTRERNRVAALLNSLQDRRVTHLAGETFQAVPGQIQRLGSGDGSIQLGHGDRPAALQGGPGAPQNHVPETRHPPGTERHVPKAHETRKSPP